jgi:hypothetical protein
MICRQDAEAPSAYESSFSNSVCQPKIVRRSPYGRGKSRVRRGRYREECRRGAKTRVAPERAFVV